MGGGKPEWKDRRQHSKSSRQGTRSTSRSRWARSRRPTTRGPPRLRLFSACGGIRNENRALIGPGGRRRNGRQGHHRTGANENQARRPFTTASYQRRQTRSRSRSRLRSRQGWSSSPGQPPPPPTRRRRVHLFRAREQSGCHRQKKGETMGLHIGDVLCCHALLSCLLACG